MKTNYILWLVLCISCSIQAAGQADSILQLPEEVRMEALQLWFEPHQSEDTTLLYSRLAKVKADFEKRGEHELARQVWMMHINHSTACCHLYTQKGIDINEQGIAKAQKEGWKTEEAELYIHQGLVMLTQGRTIPAYSNLIMGYEKIKALGFDKVPNCKGLLMQLGNAFLQIGDYNEAIHYLKESVSIPLRLPNDALELSLLNTTGICYQRMMQFDSAVVYYKKAHEKATKLNYRFMMSLTNGNLGYAYYKLGDIDKALPLIQTDFDTSLYYKETGSALNASLTLASIYLRKGDRDEAEKYIRFSTDHVDHKSDHSMAVFYDNLYQYSKLKGEYETAARYIDSFRLYNDRFNASEDKSIKEKAQLHLEMAHHANELHELEATRKRQVLIRNSLLAILVLTGVIAFLLANRRIQKRKRELHSAQLQLEQYTRAIREKNELLDSFTDEIEQMRASDAHAQDERTGHLRELLQATILTEDDWNQFRRLFDTVHPGFFIRLKEKINDLTPGETRLLALIKLQLAPREMASMLGISYDAIKKTRQRLRKKINLSEEDSLDDIVKQI